MGSDSIHIQKVQVCLYRLNASQRQVLRLRVNRDRGHFWQNITGSLKAGESYVEGALREVHEEISWQAPMSRLKSAPRDNCYTDKKNRPVVEKCFLLSCPAELDITLSPEHDAFEWTSWEELTVDHFGFKNHFELTREISWD